MKFIVKILIKLFPKQFRDALLSIKPTCGSDMCSEIGCLFDDDE